MALTLSGRRVGRTFDRPTRARSVDHAHRPEVRCEATVGQIGVGNAEVAVLAPTGTPGIADQEVLLRVVVAGGQYRVAADHLLTGLGQLGLAGLCDLLALEAVVDGEAE